MGRKRWRWMSWTRIEDTRALGELVLHDVLKSMGVYGLLICRKPRRLKRESGKKSDATRRNELCECFLRFTAIRTSTAPSLDFPKICFSPRVEGD